MKSKGYQRFCDRVSSFQGDSELIDVIESNRETLAGNGSIFLSVTEEDHPFLHKQGNTPNARRITVAHLRRTLYVGYIKELYEEVTEYLQYLLENGAKSNANKGRLVGEHNVKMDANFLLSASSQDDIIKSVIADIFQQLLAEKSTLSLINKTTTKLDLKIQKLVIEEALPYLEIRHVFVHSDGKPKDEFKHKYPIFSYYKGKIDLKKQDILNAREKIKSLLCAIDQAMIKKGYLTSIEKVG